MKKMWSHYVIVFGLAVLSGVVLLQTSQKVQQAEDELHALQRTVQVEKESIKYLEAEWVYLNTPARLESLALQYTDLVPPGQGGIEVRMEMPVPPNPDSPVFISYPQKSPGKKPDADGGAP